MYDKDALMRLQHAVVLRALADIKTPKLRSTYWYSVKRGLEIYAPLYHMTADEMINLALKSGYLTPLTPEELFEFYGIEPEQEGSEINVETN